MELRSDFTVELIRADAYDSSVVQSARVSTMGGNTPHDESVGLIRYLMRNRHGSPFEHNSMTFYVEAPISVFREWHRHRAGWSYNEESARYKQLDPIFYVPPSNRPIAQQGSPGKYVFIPGTDEQYTTILESYTRSYEGAYQEYEKMMNAGVAREVARNVLPVGIYSSMYATCNARSLMSFLSLRTKAEYSVYPSYPAWEIEQVARLMEEEFKLLMPITWEQWDQSGRVAP